MISTDALQVSFLSSLTIANEGTSLTIVNEGTSLTIFNEMSSLTIFIKTIVNETTIVLKTNFCKNYRFVFDFSSWFNNETIGFRHEKVNIPKVFRLDIIHKKKTYFLNFRKSKMLSEKSAKF